MHSERWAGGVRDHQEAALTWLGPTRRRTPAAVPSLPMKPQRSWLIGATVAVVLIAAASAGSWWVLAPHLHSTTAAGCGEQQPFCNSGDSFSRAGRQVAVWGGGEDPAAARNAAERRHQAVTTAGVALAVVAGLLVAYRLRNATDAARGRTDRSPAAPIAAG